MANIVLKDRERLSAVLLNLVAVEEGEALEGGNFE